MGDCEKSKLFSYTEKVANTMHTFLKSCLNYNPKAPGVLYHYCSVDTMLKILQNYCVWLSDAEKVNDKKELTYFCEEIQNIVSEISMRYQNKFDPILMLLTSQLDK